MAILQVKPHLTVEQLKERMQKERRVYWFKRWQMLHAVATNKGITAQEVALLLGSSIGVVRRTVQLYNREGAAFVEKLRRGGRREKRCLMCWEEEEQLLQSWEATALEGGVLVAKQLRKAVEQKVGHGVSDDYLWDLLHRHGWRKKAPRPEHPKAVEVKEKREAFKKSPSTAC
ncbi:MAG: winged helix-turn-helix domain-containing protein [Flavisolibacter sp.]|nr:winged helix-turn-helix domain-containing protein [Flavisolibacter sp.]